MQCSLSQKASHATKQRKASKQRYRSRKKNPVPPKALVTKTSGELLAEWEDALERLPIFVSQHAVKRSWIRWQDPHLEYPQVIMMRALRNGHCTEITLDYKPRWGWVTAYTVYYYYHQQWVGTVAVITPTSIVAITALAPKHRLRSKKVEYRPRALSTI